MPTQEGLLVWIVDIPDHHARVRCLGHLVPGGVHMQRRARAIVPQTPCRPRGLVLDLSTGNQRCENPIWSHGDQVGRYFDTVNIMFQKVFFCTFLTCS